MGIKHHDKNNNRIRGSYKNNEKKVEAKQGIPQTFFLLIIGSLLWKQPKASLAHS
jgi:hypothetical protein